MNFLYEGGYTVHQHPEENCASAFLIKGGWEGKERNSSLLKVVQQIVGLPATCYTADLSDSFNMLYIFSQ